MKYNKSKNKRYICKRKLKIRTNRFMKTTKAKTPNILEKMMEDKKAIQKCIREGGDLKKIAKERNVKFSTPLKLLAMR